MVWTRVIELLLNKIILFNKLLPSGMLFKLSEEDMEHYRRPFLTKES